MPTGPKNPRALKCLFFSSDPRVIWRGKNLINLSSNNYLGLKDHPFLKKRASAYIEQFGVGAGASRLVTGNFSYHEALEKKLAAFMGYETALLMNTGFQANFTLLSALADRDSLILMDRECHNSLIQGACLSHAKFLRYRHQDLRHLRQLLEGAKQKRVFVVTESLFSMEGDWSDQEALFALKDEFGAFLIIDDSHGTGLRPILRGMDLVVGSFGKAFGCFGSYLLCKEDTKERLIQKCSGLIYSTALPPMVVGAVDAALDLLPNLNQELAYLVRLSEQLREALIDKGIEIGLSKSHIIPLMIGDENKTIDWEKKLFERGFLASAIRPPTVKKSRIRLSLTALHTQEHTEQLLRALEEIL